MKTDRNATKIQRTWNTNVFRINRKGIQVFDNVTKRMDNYYSKWVKSSTRGIELVDNNTILGGDIWLEKSAILGSNSNQVWSSTNKIAIFLWMWNKIWSRACLSLQEGRFCFTTTQSRKNVTTTLLNEFWKNVWAELQPQ